MEPQLLRLSDPAGRRLLATAVTGSGLVFLDGTVANVALPCIGRELGADVAGLQWVVNGYTLALAALIMVGGSLGDRLGRKRMFAWGTTAFAVASVFVAVAPTIELLVTARILQGVAAALLTPGSLALLQASFHPDDRMKAIGAWTGMLGIATAGGPVVGGWLVGIDWRVAFWINVPIAAVVLWLVRGAPEFAKPVARGAQAASRLREGADPLSPGRGRHRGSGRGKASAMGSVPSSASAVSTASPPTPSVSTWCITRMSAARSSDGPVTHRAAQSGWCPGNGVHTRPASTARTCSSNRPASAEPGAVGSTVSDRWRLRSKSGWSTHTGRPQPGGVPWSRWRSRRTRGIRSARVELTVTKSRSEVASTTRTAPMFTDTHERWPRSDDRDPARGKLSPGPHHCVPFGPWRRMHDLVRPCRKPRAKRTVTSLYRSMAPGSPWHPGCRRFSP